MSIFRKTTHLSEILEQSKNTEVIIFIYSSECGSSARLEKELEREYSLRKLQAPIYKVTVQTEPALSRKIEEWFEIKHESPQIIILRDGKVIYTEHHNNIKIKDFQI